MTCTKRKCAGINLVKRWDNHRWFPRDHANTLLSSGVNPWSPALTNYSQNTNNPCPLGERAGGLLPSWSWTARAAGCSWRRERQCGVPAPVGTTGAASALVTSPLTHVVPIKLRLCLCNLSCPQLSRVGWALSPFTHGAGQDASTCSYKGWMWKADACCEIWQREVILPSDCSQALGIGISNLLPPLFCVSFYQWL